MKRTSLTTAVIAGLAGVAGITNMAGAVNLSNDGTGSVLIYPYYTVNNNNTTLITVVNTTNEGKAVKVRFLEGENSREVLDFNLYMSPFDVWTAAVTEAPSGGGAGVVTNDKSCTVPAFSGSGVVPFRNVAYTGNINYDGGLTDLSRTREGYVEMIEMGTVTPGGNGSLTAITHVNGTPKSCAQINGAWAAGGYWTTNANIDIGPADGGLFGTGVIVNVGEGTVAGYSADAVQGFYVAPLSSQHTAPGTVLPNIASATSTVAYTFSFNQATGTVVPATTFFGSGADAVSAVFMVDAINNTYEIDPALGASTEWVINFPTKRFYVDPALVVFPVAPFTSVFNGYPDGACEPIAISLYDREERKPTSTVDFSPPKPGVGTSFCWESQVLTFSQTGNASKVLGATLKENIDPKQYGFVSGWASINFDPAANGLLPPGHTLTGTGSNNGFNVFYGLPATGFDLQNYVNANANPGILGNYSVLFSHKYYRKCLSGQNNAACS
jgi:hypothetical protein